MSVEDIKYKEYFRRVKLDADYISHVPEEYRTKELCMVCIKTNPVCLRFIKKQDEELCLAAVRKNGWTLEYVINQTDEICLAAVKEDGNSLRFVKNKTPEICLAAVKNQGLAIEYVEDQTPEVCFVAINETELAIHYINNKTPEICLAALSKSSGIIHYIPDLIEIAPLLSDDYIENALSNNVHVDYYLKLKDIKNKLLLTSSVDWKDGKDLNKRKLRKSI